MLSVSLPLQAVPELCTCIRLAPKGSRLRESLGVNCNWLSDRVRALISSHRIREHKSQEGLPEPTLVQGFVKSRDFSARLRHWCVLWHD